MEDFLKIIRNQINDIISIKIPDETNAFEVVEINKKCAKLSIKFQQINNIKECLKYISKSNRKIFLITGSLYLVGKIREKFL